MGRKRTPKEKLQKDIEDAIYNYLLNTDSIDITLPQYLSNEEMKELTEKLCEERQVYINDTENSIVERIDEFTDWIRQKYCS